MKNKEIRCPKCDGDMGQGFIPDYSHANILVGRWHAGPPKKSFWKGTKAPKSQGVPIGAYRCLNCGYLEFYADSKFAAK